MRHLTQLSLTNNKIAPIENETEKMKVVESTDELDNDLAGVMALQRRLAGMERDLDAIQAKVCV